VIKINIESIVGDKGITQIPKKIRKKFNIKKGDELYWIYNDPERVKLIIIKKSLKFLKGRYSKKDLIYENLKHKADKLIEDNVFEIKGFINGDDGIYSK